MSSQECLCLFVFSLAVKQAIHNLGTKGKGPLGAYMYFKYPVIYGNALLLTQF